MKNKFYIIMHSLIFTIILFFLIGSYFVFLINIFLTLYLFINKGGKINV